MRRFLAGPPGPPGPPGAPGPAGDELVDEVASRVLAYIQSKSNYTTSVIENDACISKKSNTFLTLQMTHSGSGREYDGIRGPPGPPSQPGSISVNDIISLLQSKFR